MSGDARRALDICRRSTELAQEEERGGAGRRSSGREGLVGNAHVDRAVQEMFSSTKIRAIRWVWPVGVVYCVSDLRMGLSFWNTAKKVKFALQGNFIGNLVFQVQGSIG